MRHLPVRTPARLRSSAPPTPWTPPGWLHTPHDDDVVGTDYAGDGSDPQLTSVETDDEGMPVLAAA